MGGALKAIGRVVTAPVRLAGGLLKGSNPFESTPEEEQSERAAEEQRKRYAASLQGAKEATQRQAGAAQAFRTSLPARSQEYGSMLGDQQRMSLARQMQGNAAAAQSRGLLYSGLKQAADQASAGQYASALSRGQSQFNEAAQKQAGEMEEQAIQSGLQLNQMENQAAQERYKNALLKRQANQGAAGGLGGAIGSITGGILGR